MKKFFRKANENDFALAAKYWRERIPEDVRELLDNNEDDDDWW